MTAEEAIKTIEIAIAEVEWNYPLDYSVAFKTAIEALKKQIPQKPTQSEKQQVRYAMCFTCPSCGRDFSGTGIADYCYHCGQALDWSDTDEMPNIKSKE